MQTRTVWWAIIGVQQLYFCGLFRQIHCTDRLVHENYSITALRLSYAMINTIHCFYSCKYGQTGCDKWSSTTVLLCFIHANTDRLVRDNWSSTTAQSGNNAMIITIMIPSNG